MHLPFHNLDDLYHLWRQQQQQHTNYIAAIMRVKPALKTLLHRQRWSGAGRQNVPSRLWQQQQQQPTISSAGHEAASSYTQST